MVGFLKKYQVRGVFHMPAQFGRQHLTGLAGELKREISPDERTRTPARMVRTMED